MEQADKKQLEAFWADEEKMPVKKQDSAKLWEAFTKEGKPPTDTEVNPPHYNFGEVECIDAIESAMAGLSGFEGFCVGNAIKYLWRWKHKGGKTDLLKASWYLNRLVRYTEENDVS